ncbi:MAG: hypothetical protein IKZ66_09990, partial [Schwartzia sp.]|nr:hypothetical protein [Schwartzia sp. (in: firmicutes)]
MMAFRQKKLWLLPFLALLLLAADAIFLGREGAIHVDGAGAKFPAFRTETLEKRTVTNEIFAGKTTAICVWVIHDEAGSLTALRKLSVIAENLPESA